MQPHLRRRKTRLDLQKELPQPPPQYKIRIRTHNSKTFFLNVGRDCEVRQLKEVLAMRLESCIPVERLRLFTGGVEMDDEGWIFGHQLDDGDSIFCIAALGLPDEERKRNTQDPGITVDKKYGSQPPQITTTNRSKLRVCKNESYTHCLHISSNFPSIDSLLSQFEETEKQTRVQSTSTTLTTPTVTTLPSIDPFLSLFEEPNIQRHNYLPSTTSPGSSQPKTPGRMDSPTLPPSIIFNNSAGPSLIPSHKPHERKKVRTDHLEVPPIPFIPGKRYQYEKNSLRNQIGERVYEMEDTASRTHKATPVVAGRYLRLLLELYRDRNQHISHSMQLGATTDKVSKARAVETSIPGLRIQLANSEPKKEESFTPHSFKDCPECQYYFRNLNAINTPSPRCSKEEGSYLQDLTTTNTTPSNPNSPKQEINTSNPASTSSSSSKITSTPTPTPLSNIKTNSNSNPPSKPQHNTPPMNPSTTEKKRSSITPSTTSHTSSSQHSSAIDPNFAALFDAEYLRLLMRLGDVTLSKW